MIHDEWPVQDQGRTSLIASRSFEYLYRLIIDYAPTSEAQGIVQREIIQKVNKIFEDRRDRAFINVHGLQPTVYCEIFLATLILLGFAWAFSAKKLQGHLTLTAMLGVAIGLVIFLIVVFDYPFRGYFSVTTECYQKSTRSLSPPENRATPLFRHLKKFLSQTMSSAEESEQDKKDRFAPG